MAKSARVFATIDVHYFEDDRVLEAGPAWPLHFAAILFCKRTLSDGVLSRRQLNRIAPESGTENGATVDEWIDTLVRVGLFFDLGDRIGIRNWEAWNDSREDVEAMSKGGAWGNHLKWHVNRKRPNPKCEFCKSGSSGGESGAIGDRIVDTDTDEDVDVDEDPDVDVDVDVDASLSSSAGCVASGDDSAGAPMSQTEIDARRSVTTLATKYRIPESPPWQK